MGRRNLGKVRIQVKLSPEAKAKLDADSADRKMDRSAFVEAKITGKWPRKSKRPRPK